MPGWQRCVRGVLEECARPLMLSQSLCPHCVTTIFRRIMSASRRFAIVAGYSYKLADFKCNNSVTIIITLSKGSVTNHIQIHSNDFYLFFINVSAVNKYAFNLLNFQQSSKQQQLTTITRSNFSTSVHCEISPRESNHESIHPLSIAASS